MERNLLIQKNGRVFLLVSYPDRYHIIAVNKCLNEANEEKILSGNCSDAVMDDMGLTRETILKNNLRGVAIGGSRAGDVLVLYTKDKKLKYTLSDNYTAETFDYCFAGTERFQPPKNIGPKAPKADWRKNAQTESMWSIMAPVGFLLNFLGAVSFLGTALVGRLSAHWSVLCMAIMTASLVLYISFPQYYSLMGSKEYKRLGYTARVKHLDMAVLAPGLALCLRCFGDFRFLSWTPLLVGSAVAGVAGFVILYWCSREIRENRSFLIVILLTSLLVGFGVVGQVNHLANADSKLTEGYTVMDTQQRHSGRHADSYYCIVELKPGVESKIPISAAAYYELQPGDEVELYVGRGALGIAYAFFSEVQSQ